MHKKHGQKCVWHGWHSLLYLKQRQNSKCLAQVAVLVSIVMMISSFHGVARSSNHFISYFIWMWCFHFRREYLRLKKQFKEFFPRWFVLLLPNVFILGLQHLIYDKLDNAHFKLRSRSHTIGSTHRRPHAHALWAYYPSIKIYFQYFELMMLMCVRQ